jgi:hypothetical protein
LERGNGGFLVLLKFPEPPSFDHELVSKAQRVPILDTVRHFGTAALKEELVRNIE